MFVYWLKLMQGCFKSFCLLTVGHCHIDNWLPVVDKRSRLKLVVASLLCLIFMVGEITG